MAPSHGFKPPARVTGYMQQLQDAVANGDVAQAKLCLEKKANPNQADPDGWSPLLLAGRAGHKAVLELLLNAGAKLEAANKGGLTALHLAAQEGREETLEFL